MLKPQECYYQLKYGWVYATRVSADVLSEVFMLEEMLKNHGKIVYLPGFIPSNIRDEGIYLDGDVYLSKDSHLRIYSYLKRDYQKITKHLFDALKYYFSLLVKRAKELNKKVKQKKEYSDREIIKIVDSYFQILRKAVAIVDLPFSLEYGLHRLLKESLQKYIKNDEEIEKIILEVALPKKISWAGKEKENLARLAKIIKNDKKLKKLFFKRGYKYVLENLNKFNPKFYQEIKKHYRKYSWLGMRFLSGEPYETGDFILRIKDLIEAKKIREVKSSLKNIKRLKFDGEIKELTNFLQELSYLRTWRLDNMNKANFYIRPFLEVISKKLKINYQDLIMLTWDEIKEILLEKKNNFKNKIKKRKKAFGVVFDKNSKMYIITGKELDNFENFFESKIRTQEKEIKGMPAYPGKIEGSIVIINSPKEFGKFKKGKILVTQMTTPDFVPILEKARAIITDIGGVTCHAAIISRELGKPCIIGTKIATKVLRDGDFVEVDANKGVVKIIK